MLLGNEDDVEEKKNMIEMSINKFFNKNRLKLKQYKYNCLGNDKESSVKVLKVNIYDTWDLKHFINKSILFFQLTCKTLFLKYALDYFTKDIDEFNKCTKKDFNNFKFRIAEDILKHGGKLNKERKVV